MENPAMMILLNGTTHQTDAHHLADLVNELHLTGKRIAIEMNGELIPKSRHSLTPITDDCRIEIVHAVGGG
jgi:sulfur carrier protein